MKRWRPFVLALLLPLPLHGQSQELVVEAGASRFLPPIGVEGDAAHYLMGGIRGDWLLSFDNRLGFSVLAGRATDDATGGDFLSAELSGAARFRLDERWSAGVEARGLAFEVSNPFPYKAAALEGVVDVRFRTGDVRLSVSGLGGTGESEAELRRRRSDAAVTVTDELWRVGLATEVIFGGGPMAVGVSGSTQRSAGGSYRSVGGRVLFSLGDMGALELRTDVWDTPVGQETTGGLGFVIPLGAFRLRGFAGRSQPDPLTLAEPGQGGVGFLAGVRIAGNAPLIRSDRVAVARVLSQDDDRHRVEFRLPSNGASTVAVLGDFSQWDTVEMTVDDEGWWVELVIPTGTYHFGFMVDGEWFIPDNAPDTVPDEWGRRNATLVLEN